MPELPDVYVYVRSLEERIIGERLEKLQVISPFVLRTYDPPIASLEGRAVRSIHRIGKQIVWGFDDDLFLVIHLMIAGRLRWKRAGTKAPRKGGLASFDFGDGTIVFTEASSRKRASLHVVKGRESLDDFDRGGLEILDADLGAFRTALFRENRTLKRALTDPRIFSGVGNAYSDEILHAAKLSPLKRTQQLDDEESERLYHATTNTLRTWIDRLDAEVGKKFPDKVTAFRPEMAVHGRYKEPCPVCESPVQRIRYAENECNYCATCQTEGRLLADRSLSRLLKGDWPKTLEELDEMRGGASSS
ncbi:MAG: DNA-formamidopyrimidine glycosylase family protein [Planctomycetota bacterium]